MKINETFPVPEMSKTEPYLVLWTILDTGLMIVIIGENILTICALRISRKLANLISNHFVCSLAFSDLMVGLMLPYHLAFYITPSLGGCKHTCLLRFVMIVLACCASVYNLWAIALDRYIAIIYPLHYTRFMTKRLVFAIISIGWCCAITLAVCPIYWNNWTETAADCELIRILPTQYVVFVLTPLFASVWIAMLVLYWRIWKEARNHTKRMKNTSYYNSGAPNNDWKSVQVVLLILGCFSICWLPYFIMIISIKLLNLTAKSAYEATFTLAMANSGINPAIYAWKNKGFRNAFTRLLRCKNPNLSENHFSFNYNRNNNQSKNRSSISNGSEQLNCDRNKTRNGVCNGNEQFILSSEISTVTKSNENNDCNRNNVCETGFALPKCQTREDLILDGKL